MTTSSVRGCDWQIKILSIMPHGTLEKIFSNPKRNTFMTMNEHINYWIDSAENDLKAATNLFDMGNYSWSLFIGHLVLEKALKALFVQSNNNSIPPKIHNLSRLAELSKISPEMEIDKFLVSANKFHLEGRYPEYKSEFYKTCTKEFAESNFNKIKEVYEWLKSQLS